VEGHFLSCSLLIFRSLDHLCPDTSRARRHVNRPPAPFATLPCCLFPFGDMTASPPCCVTGISRHRKGERTCKRKPKLTAQTGTATCSKSNTSRSGCPPPSPAGSRVYRSPQHLSDRRPAAARKNRLLQTYSACIDYHRRRRPRRLHRRDAGGRALSIILKVMALQYRLSGSESPEFHQAGEWYPTVMDLRTAGYGDFLSLSIAQSRDC
jgi:hypothetical protein